MTFEDEDAWPTPALKAHLESTRATLDALSPSSALERVGLESMVDACEEELGKRLRVGLPPVVNNCCSQGCLGDDIYYDQPCYGEVVVIDEEWGEGWHDFVHACEGHRGGYGTYVSFDPAAVKPKRRR